MRVDKETIKKVAIGVGKVFAYGSLTLLSMKLNKEAKNIYYGEFVDCEDYNDAVDSIVESDMSDCYKRDALAMVKRNMDKRYYKAIASIANGDASDCYKVEMIQNLYKNEARA